MHNALKWEMVSKPLALYSYDIDPEVKQLSVLGGTVNSLRGSFNTYMDWCLYHNLTLAANEMYYLRGAVCNVKG